MNWHIDYTKEVVVNGSSKYGTVACCTTGKQRYEKVFSSTNLFSLVSIQISHRQELFFQQFGSRILTKRSFFVKVGFCCHLSRNAKSFVFPSFHVQKVKTGEEKISNSLPWRVLLRALTAIDVITIKESVVFQVVTFPLFAPLLAFCCFCCSYQPKATHKGGKLDKRRQMMTVKSREFRVASADEFLGRPIE